MPQFEKGWLALILDEDNGERTYKVTDRGKNEIQATMDRTQMKELGKALLFFYAHWNEGFKEKDKEKVISEENYDIFVKVDNHMILHAEIHEADLKDSDYAKENNLLGKPCVATIDCSSFGLLDLPSIISDILAEEGGNHE